MTKNILDFIYNSSSIEEILDSYITYLRSNDDLDSIQHAIKLAEYQNIRLNKNLINEIKQIVFNLYNLITEISPNLKCEIQLRLKSLKNTEEKISRNILLGHSIDIKDIIGIRVVFFNDNTLESVLYFYSVVIQIIENIISKSCLLCQAEKPVDTDGFDISNFPDIIIPSENDLLKIPDFSKFRYGIKDYILNPKSNGYQSIHSVFKTLDGNFFEIQFRNFYMHKLAECSSYDHITYKKNKYKDIALKIEPFKIHTKNYFINKESGKYIDYDGILEPIQLLVLNT